MQTDVTTPLWVAARILLRERGDDFDRRLGDALLSFDPEAIHDLRVSSRRMREGLALFAPCYPPGDIAPLVKRIKKVTRLLGEIRNRDEALLFFLSLRNRLDNSCHSDLDRLLTTFRTERSRELEKLEAGLRKISAADLRDRYRQVICYPSLFAPVDSGVDLFAPLAVFARTALLSRLADVLQLVTAARQTGNIAAQHQLRITVKHFRYRMEIVSFLLGNSYRKLYTTVKFYQEVLGKMHDLDVFAAICQEAAFSQPAATTIMAAIAAKRAKLFDEFSGMLARMPFEMVGERLRDVL
jgi:CHAD domain-containing protein